MPGLPLLRPPSSVLLPPPPVPKWETTKNVSRLCQKSSACKKQPLGLRTRDAGEFKVLAIWLVGYQGGAGALVSLRMWVVFRLRNCAQGSAESDRLNFPNPLRFAKPQPFKESPCYLPKTASTIKSPSDKMHALWNCVSSPAPAEALAGTVEGRWISQTGKYLGIGKRSPAK